MSDEVVHYSAENGIGYITLNRPPANSYEMGFMRALDDAIDAADSDPNARVVVLRSASDKFFSAGADIKAFTANSTAANMEMVEVAHGALGKMAASQKVFIALITGHALGGGLEIALACDLRIAAEGEYRLGLPEVTLGLLPGNGGTQRLTRLVGANKALELMLTGKTMTPDAAHRLGIVNMLYPAAEAAEKAAAFAGRLAGSALLAMAHIKRAVYEGMAHNLTDGLALERALVQPLFDSEDAKEGLSAFVEKRKPAFKGR